MSAGMDSYWQDRVAVITGATHGIGLRLAERLAEKGVRIATIYRNNDAQAEALKRSVAVLGSDCAVIKGDIVAAENVRALIDTALTTWGRIDFLVNNIGIDISGPIAEVSDEDWRLSQEIIVNVPFRTIKACLPAMRDQGFGRIITLGASSRYYMTGQAGYAPFGVNKAALTVLTKTLALEEIRNGITVNMVAPGSTAEAGVNPEEKRLPISGIPIGRRITRDEVTEAILYFLSENAAAATGQVLGVNGGCSV
jgi:NAD(P)-dependent dehydrogenase (short-subunit alcohol dehydrogenase family)